MPNSHTTTDGFDDNSPDDSIVQLLSSKDPQDQQLGLQRLDEEKRIKFCGLLWHLMSHDGSAIADIPDIWQETMLAIWKNIQGERFEPPDRLDAYVSKILLRQAVNFFRRGKRSDANKLALDDAPDREALYGKSTELPQIEFDWMLVHYIVKLAKLKKLTNPQTLVIRHYVTLLVTTNDFPSPDVLTESVNVELVSKKEERLSVEAVKSHKARAIRKLRGSETTVHGDQE